MEANIQNCFATPTTSTAVTPITSTTSLAYSVYRPSATTHPEDALNPVGLFVSWSAITLAGTNSYRFQVIESSDNAGQTGALTVADTGVMAITDPRLVTQSQLFLAIDWNLVTLQYLSVVLTLAGNGTPSISILIADLRRITDVPHATTVAANYTP